MSKPVQDLSTKLLYEAPMACSLLFAGIGAYMSEGDPQVREQAPSAKLQLKLWDRMQDWGKLVMPTLAFTGAATAVGCYQQTKDNLWLYGAGTLFAVIPYTLLIMHRNKTELKTSLNNCLRDDFAEPQRSTVLQNLKKWTKLHRVRVLLAATSTAIFFVARHKSQ